jgi:hypothetical protein
MLRTYGNNAHLCVTRMYTMYMPILRSSGDFRANLYHTDDLRVTRMYTMYLPVLNSSGDVRVNLYHLHDLRVTRMYKCACQFSANQ